MSLEGVTSKLAMMRSHGDPYSVAIREVDILVLPDVWSPAYDWSGRWFVDHLPDVADRSFLDVGCGTGLIAVFAARSGANRVVGVDVNPEAVRNCQLNFSQHSILCGDAYVIENFSQIAGAFDVIAWNAPHHDAAPQGMLDRSAVDDGFESIRSFFPMIRKNLNPGGTLLFGYSDAGDLAMIDRLVEESGWRVRRRLSEWRDGYNCLLYEIGA